MKYKMFKLSDLGNIITGNTPAKKNKEYYENGIIPFVKPNNFNTSTISILSEADENLSLSGAQVGRMVKEGTVLVTCIGTIGSVGIASRNICFNQQINAIEPNSDIINNRYLAYAITKRREQLKAIANAPVVPIINKTQFSAFEIPVPPLETQKKIVEVLDKAQELIDARKEQIRLMDELIQSVFYEMFGDSKTNSKQYPTCKLQELGKVGSSKRVFVDDLVENGIPFYRGTEIGSLAEGVTISPKLFITEEHFVQLKNATGIPQKGDLLMPSICPDGRIWRVDTDEAFYFKDGRVLWVNIKSHNINSIYLQYALKNKFLNDYSNIASGTTFAELKIFALKDIDILMPSIELQNEYADIINQVDKMKLDVQKSLGEIQILFDSMMHKYFE